MTETPETVAPVAPGTTNPSSPVSPDARTATDELRAELAGIIHEANGGQLHTTFATQAAAAVLEHLEPLPEWQCPRCGATTRARLADKTPTPAETERDALHALVRSIRDALVEGGQNAQSPRWSKAVRLLEQADLLRDDTCQSGIRLERAGKPVPYAAWRKLDRKYAEAVRKINRLQDALDEATQDDEDDLYERPVVDVHIPEVPGD